MLYKLALLPFLAAATASSAGTKLIDAETKAKIMELSREKFQVPRTFAAKVAKFTGSATTTSVVDSLQVDEEAQNLRSLRIRDNFVEIAVFSDSGCTQPIARAGTLVNYW